MEFEEMVIRISEKGISDEEKMKRILELKEIIKKDNQSLDDHGDVMIGARESDPHINH